MTSSGQIPIIDIAELNESPKKDVHADIARQIRAACTQHGFFYIIGHNISIQLQQDLENESHKFFSLPEQEKLKIAMHKGGKAWRGYFPVGYELTSGKPDEKEGIYFGKELSADHPDVKAGLPLHGQNLFPKELPLFRETILQYIDAVETLGHSILQAVSMSLYLDKNYFHKHYTADPLTLFRIFHYPPVNTKAENWGVGEHTDYGLLTILKQDQTGGLQVKSKGEWIDAPPVENAFICNIGDMLELITNGFYRSTLHRVKNKSTQSRLSFPFFFDPKFNAPLRPIKGLPAQHSNISDRWDGENVLSFNGTYGEYLLKKIGKVFPDLKQQVL